MSAIKCLECGHAETDWLGDHLLEVHGMTVDEYLAKHPDAPTASQRLLDAYDASRPANIRRGHPPTPGDLTIKVAGIPHGVDPDVPADVCLLRPEEYRYPTHGSLGKDIQHVSIALGRKRVTFIWGEPGCGKDAFVHALCADTRMPSLMESIKPGVDIESWWFTRTFSPTDGDGWREGPLLKAMRDGYAVRDDQGNVVRRVPYLILFTDIDRADKQQMENMRLLADSIQGRIVGPEGRVYKVLPGTIIACTGNTPGGGDFKGRMVSANLIDASILDRLSRTFQFHQMDWNDERPIVEAKFPLLRQKAPGLFKPMGQIAAVVREAIAKQELYAEFSHRAVCDILGHAEDILYYHTGKGLPAHLLAKGARCWLDKLPNQETRDKAVKLMDAHIDGGALDEGDTTHVGDQGSLADGWA